MNFPGQAKMSEISSDTEKNIDEVEQISLQTTCSKEFHIS